jgi:hypothetical protein
MMLMAYKFDEYIDSDCHGTPRIIFDRERKLLKLDIPFYEWLVKNYPKIIETWSLHARVLEDKRHGRVYGIDTWDK